LLFGHLCGGRRITHVALSAATGVPVGYSSCVWRQPRIQQLLLPNAVFPRRLRAQLLRGRAIHPDELTPMSKGNVQAANIGEVGTAHPALCCDAQCVRGSVAGGRRAPAKSFVQSSQSWPLEGIDLLEHRVHQTNVSQVPICREDLCDRMQVRLHKRR